MIEGTPDCETLQASDFDVTPTDTGTSSVPPDCTALEAKCPGLGAGTGGIDPMICDDGSTIPGDWVCDGTEDCPDGEDEADC